MGGTCPLGGEIQVTYFEQHSAPKSLWEILPESFQNDDSDEECETIVEKSQSSQNSITLEDLKSFDLEQSTLMEEAPLPTFQKASHILKNMNMNLIEKETPKINIQKELNQTINDDEDMNEEKEEEEEKEEKNSTKRKIEEKEESPQPQKKPKSPPATTTTTFVGFQTASFKKVLISEENIKQAKERFGEEIFGEDNKNLTEEKPLLDLKEKKKEKVSETVEDDLNLDLDLLEPDEELEKELQELANAKNSRQSKVTPIPISSPISPFQQQQPQPQQPKKDFYPPFAKASSTINNFSKSPTPISRNQLHQSPRPQIVPLNFKTPEKDFQPGISQQPQKIESPSFSSPKLNSPSNIKRNFRTPFKSPSKVSLPQPKQQQISTRPIPIQNRNSSSNLIPQSPKTKSNPNLSLMSNFEVPEKRITLKELDQECPRNLISASDLFEFLDQTICEMTAENAKTFRFSKSLCSDEPQHLLFSDLDQCWGSDEAYNDLLKIGVNSSSISNAWVSNHYQWIVWKLASLERAFPTKFGRKLCLPQTVFDQLRYRYEREVNMAHRSAIKKILEKDDIPSRDMILCVYDIIKDEENQNLIGLRLTDGWYKIRATIDEHLMKLIQTSKIYIGQKLLISGAELVGLSDPKPPLEVGDETSLRLSINGTHRAAWNSKLGYQNHRGNSLSIQNIYPKGGPISSMDVIVMRKYPIQYQTSLADGQKMILNEKEKNDLDRQNQTQLQEQASALVTEYTKKNMTTKDIQKDYKENLQAYVSENLTIKKTEYSPFFKVRLCDYPRTNVISDKQCLFTIWKPTEDDFSLFTEGRRVKIYGASAGFGSNSQSNNLVSSKQAKSQVIHISSTRTTRWKEMNSAPDKIRNSLFVPRSRVLLNFIENLEPFSEVDVVVLILALGAKNETVVNNRVKVFQDLFLVDESERIGVLRLSLWKESESSLKHFKPKVAVCFWNLFFKEFDNKNGITTLQSSENTEFSFSPTQQIFKHEKQKLDAWLPRNLFAFTKAEKIVKELLIGVSQSIQSETEISSKTESRKSPQPQPQQPTKQSPLPNYKVVSKHSPWKGNQSSSGMITVAAHVCTFQEIDGNGVLQIDDGKELKRILIEKENPPATSWNCFSQLAWKQLMLKRFKFVLKKVYNQGTFSNGTKVPFYLTSGIEVIDEKDQTF